MANPALFRPSTSDANVWHDVVERNEYRLPDQFEPNSLVLDIGANIGAFSYACLQRGAAKVIAFEPDPDNFALYRKQLKAEIADGRVEIYPLAVVGGSGFSWRTFSGVVTKDGEVNHGGAFLFSEEGSDYGLGEYIVGRPFKVPCVGFDQIEVDPRMNLRMAKFDCEASEWDIINNSNSIRGFGELIGEYHPLPGLKPEMLEEVRPEFEWKFVPHPNSELGLFFATRK